MSIWFIYLCMGILFLVLEALISIDGYFIWLGMAALVTSLLAWFISELGGTGSVFLFGALAVVFTGAYRAWKHYHPDIPEVANLNVMAARYIGKTCKVIQVIDETTARVQLGDALWKVKSDNANLLESGKQVRVIGQISSGELKVIAADAPYDANPVVETPESIQQQFFILLNSKNAKKHPELLQLFRRVNELYNKKPDYSFERSAFYHSYLPQSIEVFQKLDANIKLDEQEKQRLKDTLEQLKQRFRDILDVDHDKKKEQLLARIDVLNTISRE